MEAAPLTELGKLAITISVVGGGLLLAGLLTIAFWYCKIRKRGNSYYKKTALSYTPSEAETDSRGLQDASTSSTEKVIPSPPHEKSPIKDVSTIEDPPARGDESVASKSSAPIATDLVTIREKEPRQLGPVGEPGVSNPRHVVDYSYKPAGSLPDTRISTISSDLPSQAGYDDMYEGVLWPDVIDPYNKGEELELRIGDKAVDVFNCRSLTTVLQFHS